MTLDDLASALDDDTDDTSTVSSVRQPAALRRALAVAVEMGLVRNATEAINDGLRVHLESLVQTAALNAVFEAHPELRPSLADTAMALAELDHSPLADDPELIERAAREVVQHRPDADADDVLLWATSLREHDRRLGRSA